MHRVRIECTVENVTDLEFVERIEALIEQAAREAGQVVRFASETEKMPIIQNHLSVIGQAIVERKEALAKSVWQAMKKSIRYCVECCALIHHTDEPPKIWAAVRHCAACKRRKKGGSTLPQVKYCQVCGKQRTVEEHLEANRDSIVNFSGSWYSWSNCPNCHVPHLNFQERLGEAMANDPELQRLERLRDELIESTKR